MALLMTLSLAAASHTGPVPSSSARERFSARAFARPDSFHWPGYMWVWNDTLDERTLRDQLADMARHGALSPLPLPEPKAFRPTSMPTRMDPDYLTPEFFERVKLVAEESRRLGLRLWLYDEGGWPSGNVCGRLVRERPDLGRLSLKRAETKLEAGANASAPAGCLAAFVAAHGSKMRRLAPGQSATVGEQGGRLIVIEVVRNGWHPDLLNPEATSKFLRLTHQQYFNAVGAYFGTTIPLIFTDEPNMGDMPWTTDLPSGFRQTYGYDILECLPALFEGDSVEAARVRIDYFDWWSQRFAKAYFGACRDWCQRHGILFAGHLNGEDETLGARRHGFGNAMRMMREMDIPGVDAIWRQLWPGKRNHHFPKLASSVAHQEGRPWTVTESCAVYGSGLTPAQMKWIVDYQFVRGINLLDMIGYPLSTKDWMTGGERPNLHPGNPLWEVIEPFHAYAARLSYLLSLGTPRIRTALHFPIRDVWAGGSWGDRAAACHDDIAQQLLEHQCDFDLIDDEVLERDGTSARKGELRLGPMAYDTIIVGHQRFMTEAAARRLAEFANSGGRLIYVDAPPDALRPANSLTTTIDGLPALITPMATLDPPCQDVRMCARDTANGALFLITNEGKSSVATVVRFTEQRAPVLLDPTTGRTYTVDATPLAGSGYAVRLELPSSGSAVLRFGTSAGRPSSGPHSDVVRELHGPWRLTKGRSFVLTEADIEVRPPALEPTALEVATLDDWSRYFGEDFSGDGVYETTFTLTKDEAARVEAVDLGAVLYAARIDLNGVPLGTRLWPDWRVDARRRLRAGRNRLRVTVTNTLANQYIHNRIYEKWTPAQLGPYHPMALRFEIDSLPSGLLGPVRLLGRPEP